MRFPPVNRQAGRSRPISYGYVVPPARICAGGGPSVSEGRPYRDRLGLTQGRERTWETTVLPQSAALASLARFSVPRAPVLSHSVHRSTYRPPIETSEQERDAQVELRAKRDAIADGVAGVVLPRLDGAKGCPGHQG
jgi:hypothetical protein